MGQIKFNVLYDNDHLTLPNVPDDFFYQGEITAATCHVAMSSICCLVFYIAVILVKLILRILLSFTYPSKDVKELAIKETKSCFGLINDAITESEEVDFVCYLISFGGNKCSTSSF